MVSDIRFLFPSSVAFPRYSYKPSTNSVVLPSLARRKRRKASLEKHRARVSDLARWKRCQRRW